MLMRRREKTTALIVASIGVLGGGTTWAASSSDSGTALQPDGTAASGAPTVAVSDVQPDIRASFALFRDRPASAMPEDVAAQVGSPARFGRNPDLARAIKTVTGTGWVIPGNGYLCIVMPDPVDGYGTTCEPTGAAVRQGLIISMWGNMPNGRVAETLLVADEQHASAGADVPAADEGVTSVFTDAPGTLRLAP
jgi:hypothetical protein